MFLCTSEECKISLDLFFDLIGGVSIDALIKGSQGRKVTTEHSSDQLLQFFSKGDLRFFHSNDESKKFAIEVLYIKILTFIDLLKKVDAFRLKNQNTEIDLSDENIIISISSSKERLPLIWNFSVELLPIEEQNAKDMNNKSEKDHLSLSDISADATISYQKPDLSVRNKNTNAPDVFYCLGKILLRSLLVNDWNTMEEIVEQINNMTATFEEIGSGKLVNPDAVRNGVLQEMEQSKEIFDSSNIVYQEGVRVRSQGIIAEEIWDEIIIFAFNLLRAENQTDFIDNEKEVNGRNLDTRLDRFITQLGEISRLIKIELFHEPFQKIDIGEVLNAYLSVDQSVND